MAEQGAASPVCEFENFAGGTGSLISNDDAGAMISWRIASTGGIATRRLANTKIELIIQDTCIE